MSFLVERFIKAENNKERKNILRVMKHDEVIELLDLNEEINQLLDEIYG